MKTGLVLEGGALRTIFSSGVCDALLDGGVMVDYVIGVSAGIAYGVSYISRQPRRNLEIVTRYAGDRRYMGMNNLADRHNRSYFGLEFVYDTIPNELVPFDYQTFAAYPGQVEAVQTDVLTRLPDGVCDLIVSNPPYITGADMQTLSPQVRHEPELALYGGEDGLRFYRQLTRSCYDHLRPGGWFIFEIGYDQGESVPELLRQRGFAEVFCQTDLAGVPRCAGGRRPL